MIRRILNWLRDVNWLNVFAVFLLVGALVLVIAGLWFPPLTAVALVAGITGVGLAIVGQY